MSTITQPDSQISIFEECDHSARQLDFSLFWVTMSTITRPDSSSFNFLINDEDNHSARQLHFLSIFWVMMSTIFWVMMSTITQPDSQICCVYVIMSTITQPGSPTFSCFLSCGESAIMHCWAAKQMAPFSACFLSQWVQSLSQTASFSVHFLSHIQSAIMHCWAAKPDGSICCPFSESRWIRNHSSPGCGPPNRSRLEFCGDQIATFPSLLPAPVMT